MKLLYFGSFGQTCCNDAQADNFITLIRVKKLSEKSKIQQQPIQSLMSIRFLKFIVNIMRLLLKHLITILDLQLPLTELHPIL